MQHMLYEANGSQADVSSCSDGAMYLVSYSFTLIHEGAGKRFYGFLSKPFS